ncbi:LysR family transcriptional regulator [Niveispirillum cyanobacteriorum]|uniref:LysR family transcriptional regulator n=1 Tax=Niveispirillum cyanobacteriorum TaxID=1612173 RepID=A0A2K9NC71_9PROT|nr:LysR family transcriptional regulator [Niveispirillum cyanobacteriorum]AUN30689.1 LysR family transcriptional regulator [Niveispirillum cyanobacteriorum]GGE52327.1 LysR family transcriptional regulator [Niveispirillum cyanobacteriorum]
MDRLRAFEVFVAVVGKGGFAKAADALNTSPANVTRYVAELEAHLGTRLLNRTSRRLSLTEAGQTLFDRGRLILDEVAELEALAGAAAVKPRGRLRINAPVSFGIRHMAPLWPRFMALHPDVWLDIALIDRVVDIVEEGYDMAIRISRAGSQSHVARRLAVSRNLVCASPSYIARYGQPESPEDLAANHRCILYSHAVAPDEWSLTDEAGREQLVRVQEVMSSNNGDTARMAALDGIGIIRQPTFLVGDDLRAGRLVPLLPGYRSPDIDILALYPSRRHLSAKVRVMVDFLAEAFQGTPPWDRGL